MITRKAYIKRKTPLRRISKKRAKDLRVYMTKRKAFLAEHPFCQVRLALLGLDEKQVIASYGCAIDVFGSVFKVPLSQDIHHKAGRTGTNYLDENTWLAVCRENHERIHANPSWARSLGFLV
jgi:hypothetical protein